jgi:hypothetical protein
MKLPSVEIPRMEEVCRMKEEFYFFILFSQLQWLFDSVCATTCPASKLMRLHKALRLIEQGVWSVTV